MRADMDIKGNLLHEALAAERALQYPLARRMELPVVSKVKPTRKGLATNGTFERSLSGMLGLHVLCINAVRSECLTAKDTFDGDRSLVHLHVALQVGRLDVGGSTEFTGVGSSTRMDPHVSV